MQVHSPDEPRPPDDLTPEEANEQERLPEGNPFQRREMNRLWRGLLGVAILGAVAFAIFGVVLMGFAQVIPAVIVFAIAFGIALMAGPALRKKMPHDPDAYRRRMR